ncbi:MAG: cation transporter [Turicibacter sp.]|nr:MULTISPECIES: cation transporter [unclassified Turicibacter]MCI8702295.1 cation transporter [Turicibacter sp.]MCI9350535.1 cation transporter [Turicibacter sp.]MCU7203808.1 cation transporter [Turicibacter sp. TA25]MCU7208690.1 cation transporter [Turicibacter sp. 1E2]NCE77461.1 cation transporter [Turicibacter sp. TS3]
MNRRLEEKKEQVALKISLGAGILFVLVELLVAILSKSQAVLMDSVYDTSELVMILFSLKLVPLLYKPVSEKQPYGYSQVESLFIAIKGFVLVSVTVALIVNNVQIMFHGGRDVQFLPIAYFELFATVLGGAVMLILRRMNRLANSPILRTEIMEWTIDAVASFGMALAFFLPALIHHPWLERMLPYLDQVIAIFLSFFVLPLPIRAVVTAMRDIFLMAPEEETMRIIKEKCEPILTYYGLEEATYDVVRTGRKVWISIYILPMDEFISVTLYSKVQDLLEVSLAEEFNDFYIELLPDIL